MCVSAHSQHDRMIAIHMLYDHLTPHAQYIKSVPKATILYYYTHYTPMDNAKRHAYCICTPYVCLYAQIHFWPKYGVVGCLSPLPVAPPPVFDPPVSFFGQSVGCAEIARWDGAYSVRTQGEENKPPLAISMRRNLSYRGGLKEEQGQLQQTHSQQGWWLLSRCSYSVTPYSLLTGMS